MTMTSYQVPTPFWLQQMEEEMAAAAATSGCLLWPMGLMVCLLGEVQCALGLQLRALFVSQSRFILDYQICIFRKWFFITTFIFKYLNTISRDDIGSGGISVGLDCFKRLNPMWSQSFPFYPQPPSALGVPGPCYAWWGVQKERCAKVVWFTEAFNRRDVTEAKLMSSVLPPHTNRLHAQDEP